MEMGTDNAVFVTSGQGSLFATKGLIDAVVGHAEKGKSGIAIAAMPGVDLSEFLGACYDRLFFESENIVPFYFEFRRSDRTLKRAAVRYLHTFLTQYIAKQRKEPEMIKRIPDVCEIGDLSSPTDAEWMSRLIASCKAESELNDEATFIRMAFAGFRRADRQVFPIIGGVEHLSELEGEHDGDEYLKAIFSSGQRPYVLGGLRRSVNRFCVYGETTLDEVQTVPLMNLGFEDSVAFIRSLSEAENVTVSDQTVDLMAILFDGNSSLIRLFISSASEKVLPLDSFKNVGQLYCDELFGGALKGYFDGVFSSVSGDAGIQRRLIDNLYGLAEFDRKPATAERWIDAFGGAQSAERSLSILNSNEIINVDAGLIRVSNDSKVLRDYLSVRFRLEVERASRGAVFGEFLAEQLKRFSELMAVHYKKNSAIGLRGVLGTFNCQDVPLSLLFYNVFKELHKGRPDEQILDEIRNEPEKLTLPQVVYTVSTSAVYPQIDKLTDQARSAVAVGFEAADYTEEAETVWISAEVDSKLEADANAAEFWCDRLEMVALMNGYRDYRIWLVSPEGFNEEAVEVLASRSAIGSSRKQFDLLVKFLGAEHLVRNNDIDDAFELVVPMGDDTELIAAHALEHLARQNDFSQKEINQIKTALVEACINATEHSHSPDRKIYQRFIVRDGKLEITVSNRGLKFKGRSEEMKPDEGRRGWGLKLIKTLMDEVRFESVDDGTRIRMVKELAKG